VRKNESNIATTLLIFGGALIGTTALGVSVMDSGKGVATILIVCAMGYVIMGLGILLRAIQRRHLWEIVQDKDTATKEKTNALSCLMQSYNSRLQTLTSCPKSCMNLEKWDNGIISIFLYHCHFYNNQTIAPSYCYWLLSML
jgi:hypothetical protein